MLAVSVINEIETDSYPSFQVPDRGGRAYEHDIPPPEMPSFMQRQQQPQQQRQG